MSVKRGKLLLSATQSGSTDSTSQDAGASGMPTTKGAFANLHILANTRNGATVAKVQHSADNGTFADLITFDSVPSSTRSGQQKRVTGTVERYTRAKTTIGGTTGSVKLLIGFARK